MFRFPTLRTLSAGLTFTRTARAESLQQVRDGVVRDTTHHSRTFQTFLILFATLGTAPGAE